jgi:regulator of replication initiation timing
MTLDEWKEHTKQILSNPADVAGISEHLTALTDEFSTLTGNVQTLTTNNETLTQANEKLRQTNMDLFLKVGSEPTFKNKPESENKDDKPKATYENLFDDKGNLK